MAKKFVNHEHPNAELAVESKRKAEQVTRKYHIQHRTFAVLAAVVSLPGNPHPVRVPAFNREELTKKRGLNNPGYGKHVPTSLIGFYSLKNRRSVIAVLTSFEARGLVKRHEQEGVSGSGLTWSATNKGRKAYEQILEVFNDDGYDFSNHDIRTFDRDGFDRFNVDYNGYTPDAQTPENYVGIEHIFQHYYSKDYRP